MFSQFLTAHVICIISYHIVTNYIISSELTYGCETDPSSVNQLTTPFFPSRLASRLYPTHISCFSRITKEGEGRKTQGGKTREGSRLRSIQASNVVIQATKADLSDVFTAAGFESSSWPAGRSRIRHSGGSLRVKRGKMAWMAGWLPRLVRKRGQGAVIDN